jgi:uncharacterized membrane protein
MSLVFLMLAGVSLLTGAWRDFPLDTIQTLMISGLIGIFLGDTALFGSLQRLGPSRAAVVFALHAPMTVIMGWFLLSERLEVFTLIGCGIVTTGVIIAILGRKNHEEPQNIDSTHGRMRYGILLGLLGAFGQAAGAIIARPAMAGRSRSCNSICDKSWNCSSLSDFHWFHTQSSFSFKDSFNFKTIGCNHNQRIFGNGSRNDSPPVWTGNWRCWSCGHTFCHNSCTDSSLALDDYGYSTSFDGLDKCSSNCAWNCFDYNCLELS